VILKQEEYFMDKKIISNYIQESIRVKSLVLERNTSEIQMIAKTVGKALSSGHTVFWFGNGGSAADAQHLAAELVGRFRLSRKALPSIALTTDSSALTAISNDYGYSEVFVRQVEALVRRGDVVIGISTSGNSENVVKGLRSAKQLGAKTIALTGVAGGKVSRHANLHLAVPSDVTPHIQEAHIMIGHIICHLVEQEYFHVLKKKTSPKIK
jgi:D-sedoheptulose 7-phosphate isomerase